MAARAGAAGVMIATASVLCTAPLSAQYSPGARSAGMGGAGMVFSTGVDAIEWNPANLAGGSGWSLSLGEVGASALMSGVELRDFRDLISEDADSATTAAIVAGLPASGVALSVLSEGFTTSKVMSAADVPEPGSPLPTIGLAVGRFGLRVRSYALSEGSISKELLDLMVNEFDPAKLQQYRVGDTGFRVASFSEVTAAYGGTLGGRLNLGVGLRYVRGHRLTQTRFFEPLIDLTDETAEVSAVAIESPGGSGYGLDVGLALDVMAGLRVSASGTNVIQHMSWDEDLVAHEATFLGCTTGTAACPGGDDFDLSFEELVDRFVGHPMSSGESLEVLQTAAELLPGAYFPTVFRAGVGWRAGGTAVELVGSSVSPRGRQRPDWEERVSLGVEQDLWILTVRAGGARGTDGIQTLSAGIGLGLGPLDLDVSGGLMSGGFDFASDLVPQENVEYAGGHLTVALSLHGGGA